MIGLVLMARRAAIPALLAALAIAASACSPSSADKATGSTAPTATVATEPAPTTTTNPYAIPAVIDAAYVNRVLAGLDAQIGEVRRLVKRTGTIPPDAYDRLRAVYGTDRALQLATDLLQVDIQANFKGYNDVPGNQLTTTSQLISSKSNCIFARVARDYSAVGPGASTTSDRNWVALKTAESARDVHGYNRTGWALIYDGFPPDRTQPPDQCAA